MADRLAGLASPREHYENRWDRGTPKYEEPRSVRDLALTMLKLEAMTEAALQGYGALVSHTVFDRETVQCIFERGTITKSIG